MSFAYLCPTSCTCGRIVGDRFVDYVNLVETKSMTHKDALNFLGLNRICCRTTVISATPYIMRKGNTGTTSVENTFKQDIAEGSKRGLNLSNSSKSVSLRAVSKITRPEPIQEFKHELLQRGEVAVLGFERDEDGKIVMVDVGDQPGKYVVPRLSLCHGVAQINIG